MTNDQPHTLIGNSPLNKEVSNPVGAYVEILGETYYRISHYDQMPPFFINLVSSANHWLFIASTGGLTAGRTNADMALFPYETEDKIAAHSDLTGSKSVIRATRNEQTYLWEPFSDRYAGIYRRDRHLYKNIYGNKLIFEEINDDLQLTIRTGWFMGDRFGFIKRSWLKNNSSEDCHIELLDGFQNLLPYGATSDLQNSFSNLLNAYKRNELDTETGLGIFSLSATLSDRPEPSESLKATVAWQTGLDVENYLLSSEQLDSFRNGRSLHTEQDICGKAGAYFASAAFELTPNQSQQWHMVADVNQDSAAIYQIKNLLHLEKEVINEQIEEDIAQGTANLIEFVAAADGLQITADKTTTTHHFANVLFNIMRGGIFAQGYEVERADLIDFIEVRNYPLLDSQADWFAELPQNISIQTLYKQAVLSGDADLIRLCYEYLPISFSRRHGDPSRPWNAFSINLKNPDGSPQLNYQGNWRDIFQNWEPLAYNFPTFVEGMIAKFLNATTADGYNPYRITRNGIEWEVPEPDNPWANIGYWSDHQIIYLQKLLEIAENVHPNTLSNLWNRPIFAYANVPYRIRTYSEMIANWDTTIDYDVESEGAVERAVERMGTDGRLLLDSEGAVCHVTMAEKLLVLLLAKLTNLVPEGGIWMNTQRPEWNDANNALVGKGLSVVTVAYLRRFVTFWKEQIEQQVEVRPFEVNTAVATLFHEVQAILSSYQNHLENGFDDQTRRAIMDDLGLAATAYRTVIYNEGLPKTQINLLPQEVVDFLALSQRFIEQTLRANQRADGLFQSYNILVIGEQEAVIQQLYLMLEGQVALLSSGLLPAKESLELLQSLRHSDLFRAELHTYMLYPNRKLPGFQQKNNVSEAQVANSELVAALVDAGDRRLLIRNGGGSFHFNGRFRNANDAARVLDELADESAYAELVTAERAVILDLFEHTFNHRAFTGRSGTFFAYEGLGSVYWHMVSKLLLAAQECYQQAVADKADKAIIDALTEAYYDIRQGLGFNKSPAEYGAFPTDPYSHTPMAGGARQPGMTGQVKEEILTRMGELGVSVKHGSLCFSPTLFRRDEFSTNPSLFSYIDVNGYQRNLSLPSNSLAFTFCQTPIIYILGESTKIEVAFTDGRTLISSSCYLDVANTQLILDRSGQVEMLRVTIEE